MHSWERSCRSFSSWWIGWSGVLEIVDWRTALESIRMVDLLWFHLYYIGYCILECWGFCFETWAFSASSIWEANCCPVWVLTNTPLPPFLAASSAELSVYISYVSNQPAGISPQASPESGLSVVLVSVVQQGAEQVPPGKCWLWDLPGSSLFYRLTMFIIYYSCALFCTAKWLIAEDILLG